MHAEELLSRLDSVKKSGRGYLARCPAHADNSPSLSVTEGDKAILLKCWAGCDVREITNKLGLSLRDLFYDALPDRPQRREALQRRESKHAAQRAIDKARGRKADLLKHAEYLVLSARGMSIEAWSPAQLDNRLNYLADAYEVLWEEQNDQR